MREIPEEVKKSLLKKWRGNLTRYYKLRDNNWIVITRKWMITRKRDCTATKEFYLNQIKKGERILSELLPKK